MSLRDLEPHLFGSIPTAGGGISRLAFARASEVGVDLRALLKKAGLTYSQIEDPHTRLRVRDQISFLNCRRRPTRRLAGLSPC